MLLLRLHYGLLGLVTAATAAGQEIVLIDEAPASGSTAAQNVFVDDSTRATDQFTLAGRLANLQEWDKASDVYRETIEELGDRLVAARSNDDGQVVQYQRVSDAVRERLAAWPAQGQQVYRDRFGGAAQRALDAARRLGVADDAVRRAALSTVIDDFPLTAAAARAQIELIDADLVAGNVGTAHRAARAATTDAAATRLDLNETATDAQAALLFRRFVAATLLEAEDAAITLDRLTTEHADAEGLVAGQRQNFAAVAASLADSLARLPIEQRVRLDWPTLGGEAERNRIAALSPGVLNPQYAYPALLRSQADISGRQRSYYDQARPTGQLAGLFPVVADNVAYWTDNVAVHALDLAARQPPDQWLGRYPADENQPGGVYVYATGGALTPRAYAMAPVIDGDKLVTVLGRKDVMWEDATGGRNDDTQAAVVTLDRLTGEVLWQKSPDDFNRQQIEEASGVADSPEENRPNPAGQDPINGFRQVVWTGPPVVAGDAVWLLAQTNPALSRPFNQFFAVALDLETGDLVHVRYLATVGRDNLRNRGRVFTPEPDAIPSASDGVVYMPTGEGILAALDADSGRMLWLNTYERTPLFDRLDNAARLRNNRGRGVAQRSTPSFTRPLPFHAAAPIVSQNKLFYRPPDAQAILIYDAGTGRLVARLPDVPPERMDNRRGSFDPTGNDDAVRSVVAVAGDRLFGFGARTVYCIRWRDVVKAIEEERLDEMSDVQWQFWSSRIPQPASRRGGRTETIMGRPAVTSDHVLVPTGDQLALIDIATGRRSDEVLGGLNTWQSLPPDNQFATVPGGNPPEDLDATYLAGNVVVLDERILVAGQQAIGVFADRAAVRRRLLAAAEAAPSDPTPLIALARVAFSSDDLRTGIEFLDRAAALPDGQQPAFDAALALASDSRGAAVGVALDAAERLATTPENHVRVRLRISESGDIPGGSAAKIAAVRDILENSAWRDVIIRTGRDAGFTAAVAATERVWFLRRNSMPGLYDPIARLAEDALAAADSTETLLAVADEFPTSRAALSAVEQAAEQVEAEGDLDAAAVLARRLSRLALAHGDPTTGRDAEAMLARIDLATGTAASLADAAMRLDRRARQTPVDAFERDGKAMMLFEHAAAAVQRQALQAEAEQLPTADLPTSLVAPPFAAEPRVIAERGGELLPIARYYGNASRALVYTGNELQAVSVSGGWSADTDFAPEAAAWFDGDVIAWGRTGVARFAGETGDVLWSQSVYDNATAAAFNGDVLLFADGQLSAIGPDGQTRWRTVTLVTENARVTATRDVVLVRTAQAGSDGSWHLAMHDAGTGKLLALRSRSAGTPEPIDAMPLPGGRVAIVYPAMIELVYPLDPQQRLDGSSLTIRPVPGELATSLEAAVIPKPDDAAFVWTGRPTRSRFAFAAGSLVVAADLRANGRRDGIVIDALSGEILMVDDPTGGQVPALLLSGPPEIVRDFGELPPEMARRARELAEQEPGTVSRDESLVGTFRVDGRRIYSLGDRGLYAYDLDAPADDIGPHWNRPDDVYARTLDPATTIDILLGRDVLVMLDRQPDGTSRLVPFGRQLVPDKGYESGLQRESLVLPDSTFDLQNPLAARLINNGVIVVDRLGRTMVLPSGTGD